MSEVSEIAVSVKLTQTQDLCADDKPECMLCIGGKAEVWRPREGWYCNKCHEEHYTCDEIGCICPDCNHCDMIHFSDDMSSTGPFECDLCGCSTIPLKKSIEFIRSCNGG